MAVITAIGQDEPESAPVGMIVRSRTPTLEEIVAAPRYTRAQLDDLTRELAAAFDGLALTLNPPIDRDRLGAAFDVIGHQGSPAFRARVAEAYDQTNAAASSCSLAEAVDRANCAVGEVALALDRHDPRRRGLDAVQDGLDVLYAEVSR